ncbi:MAG TPA: hypothetical protein VHP58_05390 [Alphaproteobacteria bacterium]|nr:hypothetical protein [Alphaproteobacteria bacterium]
MQPQQQQQPLNMNSCQTQAMLIAADSYSLPGYDLSQPWLMGRPTGQAEMPCGC